MPSYKKNTIGQMVLVM